MKKIETDSLDPINLKSADKMKKLIEWLLKERAYVLGEMLKMCDDAGHSIVHIMQQIGFAENGRNPLWGTYGPAQGFKNVEISAFSGRLYQIDNTLEAIYELWPKLKPVDTEAPKTRKKAKKDA